MNPSPDSNLLTNCDSNYNKIVTNVNLDVSGVLDVCRLGRESRSSARNIATDETSISLPRCRRSTAASDTVRSMELFNRRQVQHPKARNIGASEGLFTLAGPSASIQPCIADQNGWGQTRDNECITQLQFPGWKALFPDNRALCSARPLPKELKPPKSSAPAY